MQNPMFGGPFTEDAAWDFIAELVEEGHPMSRVTDWDPPDALVFVLLVDLDCEVNTLYIKVQLRDDQVVGRSFHPSYSAARKHGTPWKKKDGDG